MILPGIFLYFRTLQHRTNGVRTACLRVFITSLQSQDSTGYVFIVKLLRHGAGAGQHGGGLQLYLRRDPGLQELRQDRTVLQLVRSRSAKRGRGASGAEVSAPLTTGKLARAA